MQMNAETLFDFLKQVLKIIYLQILMMSALQENLVSSG